MSKTKGIPAKGQKQTKTKGRAVPLDVIIGQNLRLFRVMAGLSQSGLAGRVNITFQQIQKNENGKNRIAASRLYEFAQILERDVNDFFEGYDGIYSNKDIEYLHLITPDMRLLIQKILSIKDKKQRNRVIKAMIILADED